MKKVLKYLGIGVVILFAVTIILGNIGKIIVSKKQKDYAQSLEGMLAEVNKHLPLRAQDGFDYYILNRVLQEGNGIVWEATLDTTFFYPVRESILPESMNGGILPHGDRSMTLDLDTLLSNNLLKQSHQLDLLYYYLFAKTGKKNPLYEEILNREYSQTWRIYSPFSDRQYEYTMTYKEMKETEDFCKNHPDSALNLFMSEYIKRQNRLLIFASDNADINMSMKNYEGTIVFYCILDKSYSARGNKPVSNIRSQKKEIQLALEEDSKTIPIFYDMKGICKKTKKTFLFRFADWNKNDSIEFKIY